MDIPLFQEKKMKLIWWRRIESAVRCRYFLLENHRLSREDFRKELQKEGNEESKEKVFVTAHGTVYHKSLKCTHLRLSVEQTTVTQAEARRNRYGAKYYACSCCKSGVGAAVYITDTGNRYHARLSCSGLKRTIREIPLSEAGKRKACSKCGG